MYIMFIKHVFFIFFFLNNNFRLSPSHTDKPILTLFTHDHCQLCEDLLGELRPFEGRYKLEKVDITAKENLKYLRLYRLDIPVLHLKYSSIVEPIY